MGQAKRRGTYEQRKAEGIARKEQEHQDYLQRVEQRRRERAEREAERRAALSEEECEAEDVNKRKIAVVTGAALGLANVYRDQIQKWNGKGLF